MEDPKFKKGDVVKLESGEIMTVKRVCIFYLCCWFEGSTSKELSFTEEELETVTEEELRKNVEKWERYNRNERS